VLARVHAKDEDAALSASQQYLAALDIGEKQAEQVPVIYQTITG
jgi:thymidine phosphorylase